MGGDEADDVRAETVACLYAMMRLAEDDRFTGDGAGDDVDVFLGDVDRRWGEDEDGARCSLGDDRFGEGVPLGDTDLGDGEFLTDDDGRLVGDFNDDDVFLLGDVSRSALARGGAVRAAAIRDVDGAAFFGAFVLTVVVVVVPLDRFVLVVVLAVDVALLVVVMGALPPTRVLRKLLPGSSPARMRASLALDTLTWLVLSCPLLACVGSSKRRPGRGEVRLTSVPAPLLTTLRLVAFMSFSSSRALAAFQLSSSMICASWSKWLL